jgi:translation initiation factor 2 beta subunit (eIF-2beta)/eIF-5
MEIVDNVLEPFRIASEKYGGFVVLEKVARNNRKKNTVEVVQKPVGYLTSVKSAVQFVIQKKLASKQVTYTLQQFLAEFKALEQEISETLKIS